MADRLISADALKEIIDPMAGMYSDGTFYVDYNAILQAIDNVPTIAEVNGTTWSIFREGNKVMYHDLNIIRIREVDDATN